MARNRLLWTALLAGSLLAAGCDLLQDEPAPPDDPVVETATLSVTIDGQGSISSEPSGIECPGDCEANFEINTVVQLEATPAAGWEFDRWEGACDGTDASCEVALEANATATAVFSELDPGEAITVEAAIVQNPGDPSGYSSNDAQEFEDFVNPSYPDGATWIFNHENNLAYDNHWDTDVLTGLRFIELDIPQGATIVSAHLQFTAASPRSDGGSRAEGSNSISTTLLISGEASDDALPFVDQEVNNISNRSLTGSTVEWVDVPEWETGASGPDQRPPDLSQIVQEIVDRAGWSAGNAMAFVISGEGQRVAYAYRENPDEVPVLIVEYEPDNNAP